MMSHAEAHDRHFHQVLVAAHEVEREGESLNVIDPTSAV